MCWPGFLIGVLVGMLLGGTLGAVFMAMVQVGAIADDHDETLK